MQKIIGKVGPEVLRSLSDTQFANHKLLRAFRDYLEDRIENSYGVMASLGIATEGFVTFDVVPAITSVTDVELKDFAARCLTEFRNNPINEVYLS